MKLLFLLAFAALVSVGTLRAAPGDVPPSAAEHSASFPAAFVTATDALFADGMSDPRGGVYRKITVRSRSVWPPDDVVVTRGWVLPGADAGGGKRAVAWNGLTYNVVTDVGPADLNADIAALVKARSDESKPDPAQLERIFAPDKSFVSNWRALELTAACLLSRVGAVNLAKRCYSIAQSEPAEYLGSGSHLQRDPLLEIADTWLGSIYDRAVQEHSSGDDRLSADDAEFISRMSARIEAQSATRGTWPPLRSNQASNAPSYLDFKTCAADILADSKRRLTAPQPKFDEAALRSSQLSTADRVAFLIRHLDDVWASEDMIPGSLRFDSDPVVEALVKEGDAAVDPLLDTMEHDNRLTHVASRERWTARLNPVSVKYAAYFCLTRILHTTDFGGTGNAAVADIRAYWNANRRLPLPDRWFQTLCDDSATPDRWLEAAKNIVAPVGSNEDAFWGRVKHQSYGSARPPMQGDALRLRAGPSVSELLIRRVAALSGASRNRPGMKGSVDEGNEMFSDSMTLALDLADWDLKASLPNLKMLVRCNVAFARRAGATDLTDYHAIQVAQMTIARMRAGDSGAAVDYVHYIRQFKMSQFALSQPDVFLPLYEYPENAMLAREADALFDGAQSIFNPISRPAGPSAGGDVGCDELIGSRLLCIPAFRRQVLRELDDHRIAGSGRIEGSSQVSWKRGGSTGIYTPGPPPDPQRFHVGTAFTFRLCDLYAWEVSRACASVARPSKTVAAPKFELYWPLTQRDAAVTLMRNYLEHEGFRLRAADFP